MTRRSTGIALAVCALVFGVAVGVALHWENRKRTSALDWATDCREWPGLGGKVDYEPNAHHVVADQREEATVSLQHVSYLEISAEKAQAYSGRKLETSEAHRWFLIRGLLLEEHEPQVEVFEVEVFNDVVRVITAEMKFSLFISPRIHRRPIVISLPQPPRVICVEVQWDGP